IVRLRTGRIVAAFWTGDWIRSNNVALAWTLASWRAPRRFPLLERRVAQYTMRSIGPSVLKANGEHRVGGLSPNDRTLVLAVRASFLRCDEARADQHAGCASQKRAADVRACCNAASSDHRQGFRFREDRRKHVIERPRGLHVAAGFSALTNQI